MFKKNKSSKPEVSNKPETIQNVDTNTTTNTPNSDKDKNQSKKGTMKKAKGSKIAQEKSELAKRLNIRISSPYGYYPEDVDPIISRLEKEVNDLVKENKKLSDDLYTSENNLKDLKSEFTQLKLQVAAVGFSPMSEEEAAMNINKLANITGGKPSSQVEVMTASALLNDDSDLLFSLEDEPKQPEPSPEPKKPALKFKLNNK